MTTQEAKKIRIADYLQSIGYSPVKRQGNSLWYKSPFREETEASFKVNTELNQWYDFGTGKGGNIIALAQEFYRRTCWSRLDDRHLIYDLLIILSESDSPINRVFNAWR